jgi:hypothetical protein
MKIFSKLFLGSCILATFLLHSCSNSENSSNQDSSSTIKEEMVPCCCCDGGKTVVYYESKYDYMGNPSGTNYDKPEPCPCCGAMKGDYENAKVTKSKSEEIKKETNHCK